MPSLDPERFTNHSGGVHADDAVLRALMDAGGQIAERLTSDKPASDSQLQPPHAVGILSIRRGSKWERFKVDPPARLLEYVRFIGATGMCPTTAAQTGGTNDIAFCGVATVAITATR